MASEVQKVRNQVRDYGRDGKIDGRELGLIKQSINDELGIDDDVSLAWGDLESLLKENNDTELRFDPHATDAVEGFKTYVNQLKAHAGALADKIDNLEAQLAGLEEDVETKSGDAKNTAEVEKKKVEAKLEILRERLKGVLKQAEQYAQVAKQALKLDPRLHEKAGMDRGEETGTSTFSLQSKAQAAPQAGAGGAAAQTKGAPAGTGGPGAGTSFTPPSGWKGNSGGCSGDMGFNSDAYVKSLATDDFILNQFDDVLKNQNRGRQLMMLFHYFAQRAASGDLGQMYQFMKFITYIISKDKSKQQIDMGKKLIELQDENRRVTEVLMNQKSDASNPEANNDFMKTMTWAKSQSDSIATSQKLVAQMMEEFATVVETLTNTTKSALEAWRRVLSTVSSPR